MSGNVRKTNGLLWLGLAFLAGLMAAGFWPSVPLHAVATDKADTFSMATGLVDADCEAVYFLDHLTGDCRGFVIGWLANGDFGVREQWHRNVLADFKTDDDKTPKFIMVTGLCDLNRGGRGGNLMLSRSVLYIADVISGKATAYAAPVNAAQQPVGGPVERPLLPICTIPFRKVLGTK